MWLLQFERIRSVLEQKSEWPVALLGHLHATKARIFQKKLVSTSTEIFKKFSWLHTESALNGIGNTGGMSLVRVLLLFAGYLSTSPPHLSVTRPMPNDLKDAISDNAQGPAKASGDAGSVEQHKLTDQIAADRYLASKEAAKSKRRGLVLNRLVPSGAD